MTQSNLLELAKQGDPQAIAALMNCSLQPRGMTATADLHGDCLEIILESEQVPNRQVLTTFVQNGLKKLGISSIRSVKLLGKQTGANQTVWVQDMPISESSSPPTVTPPPPPPNRSVPPVASPPSIAVDPLVNTANGQWDDDSAITAPPRFEDEIDLDQPAGTILIDQPDELPGTHALEYPDHPLQESDDLDLAALLDEQVDETDGTYLAALLDEQVDETDGIDLAALLDGNLDERTDGTDLAALLGEHLDEQVDETDGADLAVLLDEQVDETNETDLAALLDEHLDEQVDETDGTDLAALLNEHLDEQVDETDGTDLAALLGEQTPVPGTPALDPVYDALDSVNEAEDWDEYVMRGTHALEYPDQPLDELDEMDQPDPSGIAIDGDMIDETVDEEDLGFVSNSVYEEEGSYEEEELGLVSDEAYDEDEIELEQVESQSEDEVTSGIPWSAMMVAVLIGLLFPLGLIGYSLFSKATNPAVSVSQPPSSPSPSVLASPPPFPPASPIASPPASPTPLPPSPTPQVDISPVAPPLPPTGIPLPGSPTPGGSPTVGANPITTPPAPPAIACPSVEFAANSQPVELTNLSFDGTVVGADGDYVVGCITNYTDQAIAQLSVSFQGTSTRNPSVSQTGSTQLTFSNLAPRQSVPFRSAYTINPEVTDLKIDSINWIPANATQPRQLQSEVRLKR